MSLGKSVQGEVVTSISLVVVGIVLGLAGVWLFHLIFKPQPLKPGDGDAQASLRIAWLPSTVKRWQPQIETYSRQYGVDPNLTAIIMTMESGGDPNANSGEALGLMQITDIRAKDIASKFLQTPRRTYNLKDPNTSIEFGVANIRELINEFGAASQAPTWDQTVSLVAAGYYSGESGANAYEQKGLTGIKDQGTYNYIRFATNMWRERHDNKSFTYYYWSEVANGKDLVAAAAKYKLSGN